MTRRVRSATGTIVVLAVAALVLFAAGCGDDDDVAPEPASVTGEVVQVTSARVFVVQPEGGGEAVTVFNASGEPEPNVGDRVLVEGTRRELGVVVGEEGFDPEAELVTPEGDDIVGIAADSVEIVDDEP